MNDDVKTSEVLDTSLLFIVKPEGVMGVEAIDLSSIAKTVVHDCKVAGHSVVVGAWGNDGTSAVNTALRSEHGGLRG